MLPSPVGVYRACRACKVDLPLDGDGFCLADCSERRIDARHLVHGVVFEFCFVVLPDRAVPFVLGAWVPAPDTASKHFPCLDLPALEETAADLWHKDVQFRADILRIASVNATAKERAMPRRVTV